MFTRLVLVVLVLVLPAIASAQAAQEITAGVKAGLNISNLNENGEMVSSTNGLIAGGYARRTLKDRIAIQVEALISPQGGAYRDLTVNLNYLQIPVLGVMTFGDSETKPFVFAGPALGLKLTSNIGDEEESEDIKTSNDFSLVFGGGVAMGKFSVDARYAWGLSDVDPGSDISKNRVFSIMFGYQLK